ncbi:phytanoyl-CoA dioxygenase family protein [Dongia sedimenti]|uniref:Phytanoyl-CoA dioxygenase family protein n=1 Tax=Dongia sedimenti TaxID=3064282 RepID=A0ABU0YRV6_9PROT|nr:phytanoyl-CoA dioxygenase family protein [Rhodospirillaceae bacterium R-7]
MTAHEVDIWQRQGWLLAAAVLPEEVVRVLPDWLDAIAQPPSRDAQRQHYFEETPHGPAICRTERFLADHADLNGLITAGAVPEISAALSGEAMLLYKEKVNYKQPGGAGFAAHQDATAYPYVQMNVTALVPVDPMTVENGCLEFARLTDSSLLPADDRGCIAAAALTGLTFEPVPLCPGDVLFFTSYAPHRSGPNRTAAPRRALYLTYNRARDGDLRNRYYAERDRRLAQQGDGPEAISMIRHFQGTATRAPGE